VPGPLWAGQWKRIRMAARSIRKLLSEMARRREDVPAVLAPGREALTYGGLIRQVEEVVGALNAMGIGRGDRVGIVLGNGPELAVAFLGVACGATSAPLNPAYREAEFDFYLDDMDAKAVVMEAGVESPAREVCRQRGIRVLELEREEVGQAGRFRLRGASGDVSGEGMYSTPKEEALVLHTSGTTSRPKMVPLSHWNVCASADNIRLALRLTEGDRCLNVMPLFHIHGLMAATLATLASGGSVVCTPGFYAPEFFGWMDAHEPTWYTAVPTMHQAILSRADENADVIARRRLRFVRSSSSALAPSVMEALEAAFAAPVIEAYGMTEASHQMASNPLPPGKRKPGSVGVASGPEMAIMEEEGEALLGPEEVGEIVIRGENVTAGYAGNPEANAKAFTGGWFRTGDQGRLDDEGYVTITGRLKEIINRGGEKISPREVEEALLEHPAVGQAVAFAMADDALGEDVAAAVVPKEGGVTEGELRRYVARTLADFKVPRRVVLLDEIPKGPTGKLQRIGLAEKLGLAGERRDGDRPAPAYVAPRNAAEEGLAGLWREVLKVERVGVHERFLDVGGDSILAVQLLARVRERTGVAISMIDFFDAATVAEQGRLVETLLLDEIEGMSEEDVLGEAGKERHGGAG